jgi:uncharacterized protein YndB with AHSA1/START domain
LEDATTRLQEIPMMGILIRRPVEEVFAFVMEIERTPEWRPRMSAVEWMTDDEPGVGSRFRVTVKTLGLTVHFEPEIVAWDPPHAVTYRQSTGPAQMDSFMEWRPEGGDCRFQMGATVGSQGWMRFLAPLVGRSVLPQNMRDLIRLKRVLESDDGNHP